MRRLSPFAVTLVLSAYLLFLVQPMVARVLLPWFGGSAAVWTVCMIFFQSMLCAGYAYAHLLTTRLSPPRQSLVHGSLLLASLLLVPPLPSPGWRPDQMGTPEFTILVLLLGAVGLPYFLLASTAPLMQAWYARVHAGASPYRLYGWSNASSLAALLMYPTLVETTLAIRMQGVLWSAVYACFVAGALLAARRAGRAAQLEPVADGGTPASTGADPISQVSWIVLPALASGFLLAVTNELSESVSAMPFLWVATLAVYLVSFVICFGAERAYQRPSFLFLAIGALWLLWRKDIGSPDPSLWRELGAWLLVLFSLCMLCHGELVRLRPHVTRLTRYYLFISIGGALGGLFVGIVAPRIFSTTVELRLLAVAIPLAVAFVIAAGRRQAGSPGRALGAAAAGTAAALAFFATDQRLDEGARLASGRNFFGVLRVEEQQASDTSPVVRMLFHGRVIHGAERLNPRPTREPIIYYGETSGVAMAIRRAPGYRGKRIGVVGLGTGSLAGYAREGDVVRFYEINPLSDAFAREYFSFLPACPCSTEVVAGDARISLDREPAQEYDVLVLDAFSGDAIPAHLLTVEAFRIYLKHLAPKGVLAVHASNWYVDLVRVVRGAAVALDLHGALVANEPAPEHYWEEATWVLLARDPSVLAGGDIGRASSPDWNRALPVIWSDDVHSVFGVLRWGR